MSFLFSILSFSLGVVFIIQLASALYGIVDHWYRIARFRGQVVLSILAWGVIYFGIYALLPEAQGSAYLSGSLTWLCLHALAQLLPLLALAQIRREETELKWCWHGTEA